MHNKLNSSVALIHWPLHLSSSAARQLAPPRAQQLLSPAWPCVLVPSSLRPTATAAVNVQAGHLQTGLVPSRCRWLPTQHGDMLQSFLSRPFVSCCKRTPCLLLHQAPAERQVCICCSAISSLCGAQGALAWAVLAFVDKACTAFGRRSSRGLLMTDAPCMWGSTQRDIRLALADCSHIERPYHTCTFCMRPWLRLHSVKQTSEILEAVRRLHRTTVTAGAGLPWAAALPAVAEGDGWIAGLPCRLATTCRAPLPILQHG